MKRCPNCGRQFPDDANFCPTDAGKLDVDTGEAAAGQGASPAPAGEALGGRFVLGPRLGGSRTGEIFHAQDREQGVACAVKRVAAAVFPTPLLLQRTERELKQLERVEVTEVARVLGHGREGDRLWIATELVAGTSLDKVVGQAGPLPVDRACRLIQAIGHGLGEAAKLGVIHRDLAPKNLLLGPGDTVKILNFGVPVPLSDKVQGVPEFVSPEEIEGKPVDQRANLYSLGAVFYFMLTGRPPHEGSSDAILQARLAVDPPRPSDRGVAIAPAIEAILMKALERASAKRFLTINQLLTELGQAAQNGAGAAPAAGKGKAAAAGAQTMIGFGAVRAGEPVVAAGSSPSVAAPSVVVAPHAPQLATPAMLSGREATIPAESMQAGPAAMAAAPAPATGKGQGKRKGGAPAAGGSTKGKFRETMWFKKGELDEAAAAAAASSKSEEPVADKADSLPIEDRYKDDGTLSNQDRDRLSLRTGATMMMDAAKLPSAAAAPRAQVSEADLVGEMKKGRGLYIAAALFVIVAIVVVVVLLAR